MPDDKIPAPMEIQGTRPVDYVPGRQAPSYSPLDVAPNNVSDEPESDKPTQSDFPLAGPKHGGIYETGLGESPYARQNLRVQSTGSAAGAKAIQGFQTR